MNLPPAGKLLRYAAAFAAVWLCLKYLIPLLLPFLIGALLAAVAEPGVRFTSGRLHLPRGVCSGISVSLTLLILLGCVSLLGAIAVRELGALAGAMPHITDAVSHGLLLLQDALTDLSAHSPEALRPLILQVATDLYSGSTRSLQQASSQITSGIAAILSRLPGGALSVCTSILSGFMISARLPQIKAYLRQLFPALFSGEQSALRRAGHTVGGWLRAQLKLSSIMYCIIAAGLLILRVPYAPIIALAVAAVDAIPMLGTGAVLLPWALICLLQDDRITCIGLLVLFGAANGCRMFLEPRLVGKQIGLDPLITLLFLYLGFRFWGVIGMILAPIFAAALKSLSETSP